MIDREYLEMAAKAAGHRIVEWVCDGDWKGNAMKWQYEGQEVNVPLFGAAAKTYHEAYVKTTGKWRDVPLEEEK